MYIFDHIIGILVGLALRGGVTFKLSCPDEFYEVFACEERFSQFGEEKSILRLCALTIRHGIISVFPEVHSILYYIYNIIILEYL